MIRNIMPTKSSSLQKFLLFVFKATSNEHNKEDEEIDEWLGTDR
jgi:hypothetical protein